MRTSSRATRATNVTAIRPFAWQRTAVPAPVAAPAIAPVAAGLDATSDAAAQQAQLAAIEREAFAKGFAQGERAGAEAAASRADAMMRRLTQSLEEVAKLRDQMIHDTERQLVHLALAIARRVIHREVSLDHDLLIAIARVAMDRLAESAHLTVRLNPDDHAAISANGGMPLAANHVTVVADARLPRGGCRIESDLGIVDAGIDAQLHEIAQSLLSTAPVSADGQR
jgi:flagellar assembly protein FliH